MNVLKLEDQTRNFCCIFSLNQSSHMDACKLMRMIFYRHVLWLQVEHLFVQVRDTTDFNCPKLCSTREDGFIPAR